MSTDDYYPGFAFPRLYRQGVNHDLKYHADLGRFFFCCAHCASMAGVGEVA